VSELPVHRFDRHLVEHVHSFTGRIGQVYARTAVLEPANGGPLLALLRPETPLVPCGMETPFDAVRPGLVVTKTGRLVQVGDFQLRLTGEGQSLQSGTSSWSTDALKERLAALQLPERTRALLGLGKCSSRVDGLIANAAGAELDRLVGRLKDGAAGSQSYREIVGKLAGLGPGSTPSGDDLLLGVCALAWQLASAGLLAEESLEGFVMSLKELPADATTRTGREMLAHASRGAFFETLLQFVETLGDRAARRLEQTGGKSGCDMLAGVVALAEAYAKGAQQ
jgi:hypothetical protein